ncbi:MAG: KH domain-containing protein [Coriobacteriales bacterium]|nr:KH domain-containing protein [Coriobacteriales bacterium]
MGCTQDELVGLVETIVKQIVDDVDAVKVEGQAKENEPYFIEVTVNDNDYGHVIGRQGRIIKSIRTLARAAASQSGYRVDVELASQ